MANDDSATPQPMLELRGISKRFPGGVLANDRVNCVLAEGEIHAILGQNGAGKTTLMKIIAGLLQPDDGEIILSATRQEFRNPRDARDAGIGMVHQHFSLVPALTVADNLALAVRSGHLFYSPKRWEKYLREEASRLGVLVRPEVPVWQLSVGERQRVEVFRLLLGGARVLVLDEPTSMFAPHEALQLFDQLRGFKANGCSVFLVTHKIEHVMACADRVTVLRQGRVVNTVDTEDISRQELVRLMVGDDTTTNPGRARASSPDGERSVILELDRVSTARGEASNGLNDVSLIVRKHEIVGIAGVAGNGQEDLVSSVIDKHPGKGRVEYHWAPGDSSAGLPVGLIPSDRLGVGLAASLSVQENLVLRRFRERPVSRGFVLLRHRVREWAAKLIQAFKINPAVPDMRVSSLSGGNVQKVLLARELEWAPPFLVAASPTAGLDLAMVDFVHSRLRDLASQGTGILLLSEDLDELLSLCDRIAVLSEGRIVGEFGRDRFDRREIGLLMSGVVASPNSGIGDSDQHSKEALSAVS